MIHVAIVEDDARNRTLVEEYLLRYGAAQGVEFEISMFSDGNEILETYAPVYDIVFLDIQMEHVDGMTAARHIREIDQNVILVFITSSPQYAIGGYQVSALSYLLKPVPYLVFSEEMDRCLAQVSKRERAFLMLASGTGQTRVDVADVLYIESIKHRVTVHTLDAQYSLVGSLKSFEDQLAEKDFFRSNNCYLVNLRHVTGVQQSSALMRGGHDLQISRPRKKNFLEALSNYIGGSLA